MVPQDARTGITEYQSSSGESADADTKARGARILYQSESLHPRGVEIYPEPEHPFRELLDIHRPENYTLRAILASSGPYAGSNRPDGHAAGNVMLAFIPVVPKILEPTAAGYEQAISAEEEDLHIACEVETNLCCTYATALRWGLIDKDIDESIKKLQLYHLSLTDILLSRVPEVAPRIPGSEADPQEILKDITEASNLLVPELDHLKAILKNTFLRTYTKYLPLLSQSPDSEGSLPWDIAAGILAGIGDTQLDIPINNQMLPPIETAAPDEENGREKNKYIHLLAESLSMLTIIRRGELPTQVFPQVFEHGAQMTTSDILELLNLTMSYLSNFITELDKTASGFYKKLRPFLGDHPPYIRPHVTQAICGPAGAGKSSLTQGLEDHARNIELAEGARVRVGAKATDICAPGITRHITNITPEARSEAEESQRPRRNSTDISFQRSCEITQRVLAGSIPFPYPEDGNNRSLLEEAIDDIGNSPNRRAIFFNDSPPALQPNAGNNQRGRLHKANSPDKIYIPTAILADGISVIGELPPGLLNKLSYWTPSPLVREGVHWTGLGNLLNRAASSGTATRSPDFYRTLQKVIEDTRVTALHKVEQLNRAFMSLGHHFFSHRDDYLKAGVDPRDIDHIINALKGLLPNFDSPKRFKLDPIYEKQLYRLLGADQKHDAPVYCQLENYLSEELSGHAITSLADVIRIRNDMVDDPNKLIKFDQTIRKHLGYFSYYIRETQGRYVTAAILERMAEIAGSINFRYRRSEPTQELRDELSMLQEFLELIFTFNKTALDGSPMCQGPDSILLDTESGPLQIKSMPDFMFAARNFPRSIEQILSKFNEENSLIL